MITSAVGAEQGTARFKGSKATGRLSDRGQNVSTVRLDDYGTPDFIKMDIEGAELLAFKGAERLLKQHRTVWLVSMHTPTVEECPKVFKRHNYQVTILDGEQILALP